MNSFTDDQIPKLIEAVSADFNQNVETALHYLLVAQSPGYITPNYYVAYM